jgi:hypothetical protein
MIIGRKIAWLSFSLSELLFKMKRPAVAVRTAKPAATVWPKGAGASGCVERLDAVIPARDLAAGIARAKSDACGFRRFWGNYFQL